MFSSLAFQVTGSVRTESSRVSEVGKILIGISLCYRFHRIVSPFASRIVITTVTSGELFFSLFTQVQQSHIKEQKSATKRRYTYAEAGPTVAR